MDRYVKAISPRTEFSVVILVAFGWSAVGSIFSFLIPHSGTSISEDRLRFLLIYETLVIVALGAFLSMCGWSFRRLGLVATMRDSAAGIGLTIIAYLLYAFVWLAFSNLSSGLAEQSDQLVAPGLHLATVVAVSLLNPIFEELLVCGYIITALKDTRGIVFAVNVSVAIRLSYHLYQGAFGVISIIPLGLLFAYFFARTGRLWPVVIAHGVFDFVGLVPYVEPR